MEMVSIAELAWSDINHMAWDYTNTVTDRTHNLPHEEGSEMILWGFLYTSKICDILFFDM